MRPSEFIATQGLDDPRLIKICRECKSPECKAGICQNYMDAYYAIYKQAGPRRRPTRYSIFGVRATVKEWAEWRGMKPGTVRKKMEQGIPLAEVLGFPHYNDVLAWEKEREAEKDD